MSLALKLDGRLYPVLLQRGLFARSLVVLDGQRQIAHLTWQEYTGEIRGVRVEPADLDDHPLRRRGIATTLLRLARDIEPRLHHSAVREDDGDAWARSTGDPLPDRLAA